MEDASSAKPWRFRGIMEMSPTMDAKSECSGNGDKSHEKYEEEHVHAVYQEIAGHFSSTRYKVSPIGAIQARSMYG